MTPEPHELSALDLAAALRRLEVTAVEVTEQLLERAMGVGPTVGAFVHLANEAALQDAAAADRLLATADPALEHAYPLLGVPCPIKDLNPVAGMPFESGSAAMVGTIAQVTDGVARLLHDAGTIMLGKTTTPEFGLPAYTEPDTAPPARTPWDLTRSAGGSSGGAAAAVAAGLSPLAHASDGGGSIRIPASACGLVGLKPSRGRVSPGPHGTDGAALATQGLITRTVRDTALGLDVIGRPRAGDHFLLSGARTSFLTACDAPVSPLRVGLLSTPVAIDTEVHPACLRATERAAELLRGMGHEIVPVERPYPPERWAAFSAIWAVMAASVPVLPEREHLLTPLTRSLRERGRGVSGVELASAMTQAQKLARHTAEAWSQVEVVLSPTLARPPAPVGSLRDDADPHGDFVEQTRFTPWTSLWNITGAPAISLPLHREEVDGVRLPFGVMLGARLGQEELLLALAARLEALDPWPSPVLAAPLPA